MVVLRAGEVRAIYHKPCWRQMQMEKGAGTAVESKYGEITASDKDFHPGEPLFILRATDPLAVPAIIDYGKRCQRSGASEDHTDAVFERAMEVGAWQRANPEKVKAIPD